MLNLHSKPLAFALFTLFILLQYELWFAQGNFADIWHIKQAIATVEMQNTDLKERNMVLAAEVEDLKKGDEAAEERARDTLGMVKKGEMFYQIVQ